MKKFFALLFAIVGFCGTSYSAMADDFIAWKPDGVSSAPTFKTNVKKKGDNEDFPCVKIGGFGGIDGTIYKVYFKTGKYEFDNNCKGAIDSLKTELKTKFENKEVTGFVVVGSASEAGSTSASGKVQNLELSQNREIAAKKALLGDIPDTNVRFWAGGSINHKAAKDKAKDNGEAAPFDDDPEWRIAEIYLIYPGNLCNKSVIDALNVVEEAYGGLTQDNKNKVDELYKKVIKEHCLTDGSRAVSNDTYNNDELLNLMTELVRVSGVPNAASIVNEISIDWLVDYLNALAMVDTTVWRNEQGKFNTLRLVSDSVAGVVLGTVGGVVTSTVMKKNQLKRGFEFLRCNTGGQDLAGYGDEFVVSFQQ